MQLSKKKKERIEYLIDSIDKIIELATNLEEKYKDQLEKVHPKYKESALNLIHYRAVRSHDSSDLQKKLGDLGMSRMARNQDHVMDSLQNNKAILKALLGKTYQKKHSILNSKKSRNLQKSNSKLLLGYRSKGRRTRIMVTLPSIAAEDYTLVKDMIKNGMNCARINCAHDGPEVWLKMIANVKKASKKLQKKCKVAMDLGGPKIRTGQLLPGPKILKLRPAKDVRGKITHPLKIWIGTKPQENTNIPFIPISQEDFEKLKENQTLFFKDTRDKKRRLEINKIQENGCIAFCPKTTYVETGLKLFLSKDKAGESISVGELPEIESPIILHKNDILRIDKHSIVGSPAKYDEKGKIVSEAHIYCTAPEIIDQVKENEPILFDDGKIRGAIRDIKEDELVVEIIRAATNGGKLRSDKGINLPISNLNINGLTPKDKKDLEFVTQHADVVNMSFVNRRKDVRDLLEQLKKNNAKENFGIILKIETQSGYNNLFEIILEAMQVYPLGVMIARGDLAIEVGWTNIGRVQEEILSICQAAHVTDVWATQVLESLAKNGIPSRAEITDVIKAQQADCVMLNKGPFILSSIKFLDRILKLMEPFREKNKRFTPKINKADAFNL